VRRAFPLISAAAAVLVLGACGGSQGIELDDGANADVEEGATLFAERCSGCHTLEAAGTQGSSNRSQRVQGPNFDQRKETYDDVIFAIRNGGFSGAIMPQNIVVGDDADKVAQFLSEYAGQDVEEPTRPGQPAE
jgi:mono/diheme cytochrome c family protein